MLLGDASAVNDGILHVLLFPHDLHHLGQDAVTGCVVDEKVFLVGALSDDVGTFGCQRGFVGLRVLEEFAIYHAETIANEPYLAA